MIMSTSTCTVLCVLVRMHPETQCKYTSAEIGHAATSNTLHKQGRCTSHHHQDESEAERTAGQTH